MMTHTLKDEAPVTFALVYRDTKGNVCCPLDRPCLWHVHVSKVERWAGYTPTRHE